MKHIFLFLAFFMTNPAKAQLINGSFENSSGPDLTGWNWTCFAQSFNDAPPAGGNWCIQVYSGNTQGCWPGYAYQKFPAIANGQTVVLSAQARAQTSIASLCFGKTSNGVITIQSCDTTTALLWTPLNVWGTYVLQAGDTAIVLLSGGMTGGPVQGFGWFDLVTMQLFMGASDFGEQNDLTLYPNPFSISTTLYASLPFQNATLSVYNLVGQKVKEINGISGNKFTLNRDNLPNGIYFAEISQNNKIVKAIKLIIVETPGDFE